MLASSFWSELGHAAQMELLAVAAILAVAIAVVVDLRVFIHKNLAPWKKRPFSFLYRNWPSALSVAGWAHPLGRLSVGAFCRADRCRFVFCELSFCHQVEIELGR